MSHATRLAPLAFILLATSCGSPATEVPADAPADRPDGDWSSDDAASADAVPPSDAPPVLDGAPDASPDGGPVDPPPPPALERGQAGGETAAIAIVNGRAYVGVGPRLTVWQLGSTAPLLVGASEPLPGVVSAVTADDDHAFVTTTTVDDGQLHIFDVSNVIQPFEIERRRLGTGEHSQPIALARAGNLLYVADREQGVFRVDVSAPYTPVVTAFAPLFGANDLTLAGDRILVAAWSFFGQNVDTLAADDDLTSLGSAHFSGAVEAKSTADGHVITRYYGGFAVHDLAEPTAPVRVYENASGSPSAIITGESGAWLTIDGNFRYLDLAGPIALGPATPALTSVHTGAFVGGHLAIATDHGDLELFDVGETSTPTFLGRATTGPCRSCDATAGAGTVLAVAAPRSVSAISPSDLSTVGAHRDIDTAFVDIAYADGRVYVVDGLSALWAYDLSNPSLPFPSAHVAIDGAPSAVAVAADHVLVGGRGALHAYSLDGASDPVQLGAVATGRVVDIAVVGDLAFVAEGPLTSSGGLRIYDVGDPAAIRLVGELGECEAPTSVAVDQALAALGCDAGLHIVDVSNPAAPITRSRWQPAHPQRSTGVVAIDGDHAYLGGDRGVSVVDVTNADAPTLVETLPTAWAVRHLDEPYPGRVVASTTRGGIHQWQR